MSSHLRWLAALVLLFACNAQAHADVCFGIGGKARRDWIQQEVAAAAREHEFVIVRDATAKEAELRIPRKMLVADASTGSSTRTAMAGLALSTAFVGGGLWCMRFRGPRVPRQKLVVAGVLGLLLVGCLSLGSFADATPPTDNLVPGTMPLGEINVKVRIVDQGDQVELVVPPELADKIGNR